MQETTSPLNIWHKTILDNDPSGLYDILDDSFELKGRIYKISRRQT